MTQIQSWFKFHLPNGELTQFLSILGLMSRKDIDKKDLYESVKTLIEADCDHIHFNQQKLYTLFSIAFQYMLYQSGKKPGAYIIRAEHGGLAEKLARKSKDEVTRKFMNRLLRTRKLSYERSTFYLDYFNFQSWNITSDIPPNRLQGAIIVQSTSRDPMNETSIMFNMEDQINEDVAEVVNPFAHLGDHYYVNLLKETCKKTITVAFEENFEDLTPMSFDFIPDPDDTLNGVKISSDFRFK